MKRLIVLSACLAFSFLGFSQGMAFGFKGGPSLGFQKWGEGGQRDALIAYHGIAFVESLAEHDEFAIFAQLGYCLLYTSPSPRDRTRSRMPSSA